MLAARTFATKEFPEDYENPRKIPRVQFIENVEDYIKGRGITSETIIRQLQQQHSKYMLMESKLSQSKTTLGGKIREINKTIDTVKFLQQKLKDEGVEIETNFGLTESVFCSAKCPPQNSIHLWLGANVMCEYTFADAIEMLEKNLAAAKENLAATLEDLSWLKDQRVILEVNVARMYNHDVISRREKGTTEQA